MVHRKEEIDLRLQKRKEKSKCAARSESAKRESERAQGDQS